MSDVYMQFIVVFGSIVLLVYCIKSGKFYSTLQIPRAALDAANEDVNKHKTLVGFFVVLAIVCWAFILTGKDVILADYLDKLFG